MSVCQTLSQRTAGSESWLWSRELERRRRHFSELEGAGKSWQEQWYSTLNKLWALWAVHFAELWESGWKYKLKLQGLGQESTHFHWSLSPAQHDKNGRSIDFSSYLVPLEIQGSLGKAWSMCLFFFFGSIASTIEYKIWKNTCPSPSPACCLSVQCLLAVPCCPKRHWGLESGTSIEIL